MDVENRICDDFGITREQYLSMYKDFEADPYFPLR